MSRTKTAIAMVLATMVLVAGCSEDPNRAKQEYLKSGDRFFDQKQYNEAIVQYRNALQQDPRFGAARHRLAQAYEQKGDGSNAYREYIRAADLLPADVALQMKAGNLLLATGQFEDAKTRATKVLERAPNNVDARVLLGNALAGLKEFDQSVKELEEAVALSPTAATYTNLGAVQQVRGSKPEAELAFRKAVETDPKSGRAQLALAGFLWSAGRRDQAEAALKSAYALDRNDALANRGLAMFYTMTGRVPEAEPHLKKLAELDKSPKAPGTFLLVEYYLASNRSEDAMRVLQPLSTRPETTARALTRIALIQYSKKLTAEAYKSLAQVLDKQPKYVPALVARSTFLLAERKYDEALGPAKAAVAAEASSAEAHFALAKVLQARGQLKEGADEYAEVLRLNPRAALAEIELAQLNLQRGKIDTAMQMSEQMTRKMPDNPAAHVLFARTLVVKGNFRRAQGISQALARKYPKGAIVQALDGSVKLGLHDLRGAREAFERAQAVEPANLESLTGLTRLDVTEGKMAAANARLSQRLKQTPNDPNILLLTARLKTTEKDYPAAEELLKKAIEVQPNAFDAYSILGTLYGRTGRLDEARRTFEQLAAKRPDSIAAPTVIAMLYQAQKNGAEARKRYEQILQKDPRAAVAANNLAWIYAEEGGNLDVALQLAQTAKSQLPDVPQVNDTLGWVYVRKDLATLAVPPLEQAAAADPKSGTIQYHLGMAYLKAGNKPGARRALEQALVLDPNLKEASKAREALTVSR